MDTADQQAWIDRIRTAHQAAADAAAAEEQTIRDAHAAGATESVIARDALGTQSRGRVRAILGKGPSEDTPRPPAWTPVVLIEGKQQATDEVAQACWARGWQTTHSSQDAWRLARAGVPVVRVALDEIGGGLMWTRSQPGRVAEGVGIGPVAAKYRDDTETLVWSGTTYPGTPETWDPDRPNAGPGQETGARVRDVPAIARLIASCLG